MAYSSHRYGEKNKTLGENIKMYRKKKKLTQLEFAELIDISPRHLSRIENGQTGTSIETLNAIAAVLNINHADLFVDNKK